MHTLTGACSPRLVWKATMQYSTDFKQENTVCRRLRNSDTSLSCGPADKVVRSTGKGGCKSRGEGGGCAHQCPKRVLLNRYTDNEHGEHGHERTLTLPSGEASIPCTSASFVLSTAALEPGSVGALLASASLRIQAQQS